jgi:hypothetical protein
MRGCCSIFCLLFAINVAKTFLLVLTLLIRPRLTTTTTGLNMLQHPKHHKRKRSHLVLSLALNLPLPLPLPSASPSGPPSRSISTSSLTRGSSVSYEVNTAKAKATLADRDVAKEPKSKYGVNPRQVEKRVIELWTVEHVKNMVMGLSACIEDVVEVYLSGGRWQVLYICHQPIKPCSRLPRGCLTNYIQQSKGSRLSPPCITPPS